MRKLALGAAVVAVAAAAVCFVGLGNVKNREKVYLERSVDLARIWNLAGEYYGYWDQLGGTAQWDAAYEKAVSELLECRTDFEYLALLEEFLSVLQDGRAGVLDGAGIGQFPADFRPEAVALDWGTLPFGVEVVDGQFVVSQCMSGSEIPLYARITQLDGKEPLDYLEEEYGKRVGVQTAGGRIDMLASALRFSEAGKKLRISFETASGEEKTVSAAYKRENVGAPVTETAALQETGELAYDGEFFDVYERDGVSCVKFLEIDGQAVVQEFEEEALPLIMESAGCILDLRGCTSGDSAAATGIFQHFSGEELPPFIKSYMLKSGLEMRIARAVSHQLAGSERYEGTELAKRGAAMNSGQYFYRIPRENDAFSESVRKVNEEELGEIEGLYFGDSGAETSGDLVFQKPCAALIGKKTAMGGECMAAMAREAGVTLIGETTAGIFGDVVMEQLSNGWIVTVSSGNIYTPDGEAIWNRGIAPDVEHVISLEDYRAGRDTAMERAVEYLAEMP